MFAAKTPDSSDPADTIAAYYPDSKSHRVWMIVAAYVLIGSAMLFLWFLSGVRSRLRAAEGTDGTLSTFAFGAGVVSVGMLCIGGLSLAAVPGSITFGENKLPIGADTIQIADSIGYGAILIGAMLSAAVMIFAISVVTLRTGALPKWSAWVGILAGSALLFAVIWIPQIALLIWTLCVSIAMLTRLRPRPKRSRLPPPDQNCGAGGTLLARALPTGRCPGRTSSGVPPGPRPGSA